MPQHYEKSKQKQYQYFVDYRQKQATNQRNVVYFNFYNNSCMIISTIFALLIWPIAFPDIIQYHQEETAPSTAFLDSSLPMGLNITEKLLNIKKGGSNVLSEAECDLPFFPCDQQSYNCGFRLNSTDHLTVAAVDGTPLNLTYSEILNCLPSNATLSKTIRKYIKFNVISAKCVSGDFPSPLPENQSKSLINEFLKRVSANISTLYNQNRARNTSIWSKININIKNAVVDTAKINMTPKFLQSPFWESLLINNWNQMSMKLKEQYNHSNCSTCLHSAYMIDSVTIRCSKQQSINFLVDESGSIGPTHFEEAKKFLSDYASITNDDANMMSIHFYDGQFDPWIHFGNGKASMLSMIARKPYRAGMTHTGAAISNMVNSISNFNIPNGIPKILIVLTDGGSHDSVVGPANQARRRGIILFCVGIGQGINQAQLLEISGTQTNIVYIYSYQSLNSLVSLIQNYFCKQIIDLKLNGVIEGNHVRIPTSPSYFRIQKSKNPLQYYKISISYRFDPTASGEAIRASDFDPFPDDFSMSSTSKLYHTGLLERQYFVSPISSQGNQEFTYVSVAGTNLTFKISLTACATFDWKNEMEAAADKDSKHSSSKDVGI